MIRTFSLQLLLISVALPFTALAQWAQLGGPGNGGYVEAFCEATMPDDSRILLAGTHFGGIFKSFDDGLTWVEANAGLTNYAISAVTTHRSSTGDIVFFTGCDAGTAYFSDDGADTWRQVDSLPDGTTYSRFLSVPTSTNHSILYAGTGNRGIYRSTDDGVTWDRINSGLSNKYVTDLASAVLPTHTELYAATSNSVFRSLDLGENWINVSDGLSSSTINALVTSIDSQGTLFLFAGTDDGVYVSYNTGTSWSELGTKPLDLKIVSLAVVNGSQDTPILLAGAMNEGIYITTDLGATWTQPAGEVSARGIPALLSMSTTQGAVLLAASYWKGPYRSTDYGVTWLFCGSGITNTMLWYFDIANAQSGSAAMYSTAMGRSLYVSEDFGKSWAEKDTGIFSGISQFVGVAPTSSGTDVIFVETSAGFHRSLDGGQTWVRADNGLPEDIHLQRLAHHQNSQGKVTIYIAPLSNRIYYSTNAGDYWSERSTGVFYPWAEDLTAMTDTAGTDILYGVSYWSNVLRSTNHGADWFNTGIYGEGVRSLHAFETENQGPIVFAGFNEGGEIHSSDMGVTWSDISADLPECPVYTFAHYKDLVFAGTGLGVYVSTDLGNSWIDIGGELAYTSISSFKVGKDAQGEDVLYAATYGRSLWSRRLSDILILDVESPSIPATAQLLSSYPNPVALGSQVTVRYTVERTADLTLRVTDILGRTVREVPLGQVAPGTHTRSIGTEGLEPGMYFYSIASGNGERLNGKMVVR